MALTNGLPPASFSYFLAKYSKTTLSIVTIAIKREPNAREPKWYLNAHQRPVETLTPSASDPALKYQRAHVVAIVNYKIAIMKATIQKKPNMKTQNIVLADLFSSNVANIYPATNLGSPVLYK